MRSARGSWVLVAACTLSACKVGPNFTPPSEPVPDHYAGVPDSQAADTIPPSFWWQEFHDPELDRLETQAAAGNLDRRAAFLRIVEARSQVQLARSQGLPSLDAAATYNRVQVGLAGILKSEHVSPTSPTDRELFG